MVYKFFRFIALLLSAISFVCAEEPPARPNVLWIVSEDNSWQWIGCYGNEQAETPHIDTLASQGVRFNYAYSNAPVCAVARATLLRGMHSPTMGTQHMRSRYAIPKTYHPYPAYLRQAGYYCTNNAKTDYNSLGDDRSYWDASSRKAHYKNRTPETPFFAVFNLNQTHESSLFIDKPRDPKRIPIDKLNLPPYLPDLPEVRRDYARYHDRITAMDSAVGKILAELERSGLTDDTIVVYMGDHGGATPRGKRYLYDTGTRVPLIIRIPSKWQHLSPFPAGSATDELVAFIDLMPTFLSLAEITPPAHLQGRPFLGKFRRARQPGATAFLYADRFDETYGMHRGITTGKWKYIRHFTPHLPAAPRSNYSLKQPGWKAWQQAAANDPEFAEKWRAPWQANQPVEELYNLSVDPWEIHNLATDTLSPEHEKILISLRQQLKGTMRQYSDTGIIPEPLFGTVAANHTLAETLRESDFPYDSILDLAFLASERDPRHLPALSRHLSSSDPVIRSWALLGFMVLGEQVSPTALQQVLPLLDDPEPYNRTRAALALWYSGEKNRATQALLKQAIQPQSAASLLYLYNYIDRFALADQLPANWERAAAAATGPDFLSELLARFLKRHRPAQTDG